MRRGWVPYTFLIPVYGSPFSVHCSHLSFVACWTGGRVAEGVGLENRYTLTGIVGSNPTLSVDSLLDHSPIEGWSVYPSS